MSARTSVLIVSHDVVGHRMAGPGIRYWELARVLAGYVSVTLAVPGQTSLRGDGFALHAYEPGDWETLRAVVECSDVLMPCGHTLVDFPALTGGDQPLVIDGYDPFAVETLVLFSGEPIEQQEACQQGALALLRQQCRVGDFFICASERQRDWWLGALEAGGRVNVHTYGEDPSLRRLVDVVPFGLPASPPRHTRQVLKGVWPGIGPQDRVVLWGGGLWQWLDPLTAIRAMARVGEQRADVKLVFPGTRHPNTTAVPDMPVLQAALRLARELDLLDRCVFFGDWVPYEEWANYLLESDVGLSLHPYTVEARLAFRSRVLDYAWAGLPMVVSKGDATSEMVVAYGLGLPVDCGSVDGVAEAILALLDEPRDARQARFAAVQADLAWERAAQPLVEFCRAPLRAADRRSAAGRSKGDVTPGAGQRPDAQAELRRSLADRDAEIARLQELVAGYERGRFIRLMRWLHSVRQRRGGG